MVTVGRMTDQKYKIKISKLSLLVRAGEILLTSLLSFFVSYVYLSAAHQLVMEKRLKNITKTRTGQYYEFQGFDEPSFKVF